MAYSRQAKKRARQAEKRRCHNSSRRTEMRTYIKDVVKAIAAGDKDSAKSNYQLATSMVDKLVRKGLIHANKAARHKSRLNKHLKAMSEAA